MIYHVFNNTNKHYRVSAFIKKCTKADKHFFVILMTDGGDSEDDVRALFARLQVENYYITKKRSWIYNPFITFLALLQGRELSGMEQDLFHFLKGVRKSPIVFHGVYYSFWALLLHCGYFANVSWVCWNWRTPVRPPLLTPRGIHYHIKRYAMRGHRSIVCLMSPDSEEVKEYTALSADKICTMPYPSAISAPRDVRHELETPIRILLGNNAYLLTLYPKIVDALGEAGVPVEVCIMVPYGANDAAVSDFKKNLSPAGNVHISYWSDMVSADEYLERLATFDYYVCPAVQQSGLGAIYRAMRLGAVCFLDGANYEWIKSSGGIVFHISELGEKLRQRTLLSGQDRTSNKDTISRITDTLPLWDEFFVKISAGREKR